MKTERRHELEQNTLAQGLSDWGEKVRPYSTVILAAIGLLVGVYVAATLWNNYQSSRNRAAWDDYQLAMLEGDAELRQLQRLANSEDHQGTEMQEWALVGWADRQLLAASREYLVNREQAKERLTDIEGIYEQFAESGSTLEIRNRSRLGLARVSELQNKLEEARRHYAQVEGALGALAAERIKQLESKEAQEASAWLATAELPKPKPGEGPGVPGQRPGFEATPPAVDAGSAPAVDTPQSLEEILRGIAPSEAGKPPAEGQPPTQTATPETPSAETGTDQPAAVEPAATEPEEAASTADEPAVAAQPADASAEQPAGDEAEKPVEPAAAPAEDASAPAQQ
jgi:hypothetical protein